MLDLARELHALGHDVKFYSYVPRARALGFGLPEVCHVNLLPYLLPLLYLQIKAPNLLTAWRERAIWWLLNWVVIKKLMPCDVVIGMSGIYLEAFEYARKKYGAQVVVERGSKHILAQRDILSWLPGAERPSELTVSRELAGYNMADLISIPSSHVCASFSRDPIAQRKCVVNPYGVDLLQFRPVALSMMCARPVFLFAGIWSQRKGCDLLVEAVKMIPEATLIHVGDIGDCAFPFGLKQFEHIDKVDQRKLSEIYSRVNVFVLASREDGFGVVLAQALASGLPVVCTVDTGGLDLCHSVALKDRIQVVPSNDVNALVSGMRRVAMRLNNGPSFAEMADSDRELLGWSAYGMRYSNNLARLFG
jgi:glycosyltransferase involved in cell wall biosynthesis